MTEQRDERTCYRVAEVARRLGLSVPAVYQHVTRGSLPAVRLGRCILIPRSALERFERGQ